MKKVFMIAHQFPPVAGSGVQRTSKFVKYLPEFGYEPIVFTINPLKKNVDKTLEADIDPKTKVIRSKPFSIEQKDGLLGIIGKVIAYKVLMPDHMWLWYRFNRKKALSYVKENNIDLIYSTSSPYSGHLMGLYIKKKLPHIKWIVDFRDEWTNNPYILDKNYNVIRKAIEKRMESQVAYTCDQFITNTPLMLKAFLNDYDIEHKTHVIPNGFDKDDFEGFNRDFPKNEKMNITYSGAIYGRTKPDAFFIALKQAIENKVIDENKLVVKIIGSYSPKLVDRMRTLFPYEKVLSFIPYMPHKESVGKLLEADALLFIIGIGKGSEKIYTGKIFEYFYANRPMVAMVPENSVAGDIIEETNTGKLCGNDDPDSIYKVLVELYEQWEKGQLSHQPNWDEISKYERATLTKKLVGIFDNALSQKG